MLVESDHSLTLLGLPLVVDGEGGGTIDYEFEVSADGTEWGNPDVAIASLASDLSAGGIEVIDDIENRSGTIFVRVASHDADMLAVGGEALYALMGRPGEMSWRSPKADVPTVHDVSYVRVEFLFDDMDELRLTRAFRLTVRCLPWVRDPERTTITFPDAGAVTEIDDGTSTEDWSVIGSFGQPVGSVAVSGGAVRATFETTSSDLGDGRWRTFMQRARKISVATESYLRVRWRASTAVWPLLVVESGAGAQTLSPVRTTPSTSLPGFTVSWFQVPTDWSVVSMFKFGTYGTTTAPGASAPAWVEIADIGRASAPDSVGSSLQRIASHVPVGTMDTELSLTVTHPTQALGRTIIYTHPINEGYGPALRPFLAASSPVTADASRVSGAWQSIVADPSLYVVPAGMLPPGKGQAWALIGAPSNSGLVRLWVTCHAHVGEQTVGLTQSFIVEVYLTVGQWSLLPLAQFSLPPAAVGPGGKVQFGIQRETPSSFGEVLIDEFFVFARDKGRLTVADCGSGAPTSGGAANRLMLREASFAEPNGALLVGTKADGSDAHGAVVASSREAHEIDRNGSIVYVAAETGGFAVDASYFARYGHSAHRAPRR